jgi:hypothetical protein
MSRPRPSTVVLWLVIVALCAALYVQRDRARRREAQLEQTLYRIQSGMQYGGNPYPDSYRREMGLRETEQDAEAQRDVAAAQGRE